MVARRLRTTLYRREWIRKKRQRRWWWRRRQRRDARNPLTASQPSGQPPPAAAVATPECIPTVGDYRDRRGCMYRHAADRLVGVSAGGITSSGKKHPSPLPSFPPCRFTAAAAVTAAASLRAEGRKTTGVRSRRGGRGRCTERV